MDHARSRILSVLADMLSPASVGGRYNNSCVHPSPPGRHVFNSLLYRQQQSVRKPHVISTRLSYKNTISSSSISPELGRTRLGRPHIYRAHTTSDRSCCTNSPSQGKLNRHKTFFMPRKPAMNNRNTTVPTACGLNTPRRNTGRATGTASGFVERPIRRQQSVQSAKSLHGFHIHLNSGLGRDPSRPQKRRHPLNNKIFNPRGNTRHYEAFISASRHKVATRSSPLFLPCGSKRHQRPFLQSVHTSGLLVRLPCHLFQRINGTANLREEINFI